MTTPYATQTQSGAVHLTTVEPLDARIVKFRASVRLPDFPHLITPASLSLYEALSLSGTRTMTKEEIDTYIRRHGLQLSIHAGGGYAHFELTAMAEQFKNGISLIAKLITQPKWPQKEFTIKRHTELEGNREAHDDARRIASIAWNNLVFPAGARGRLQTLAEERVSLTRLTLDDVRHIATSLPKGEWYVTVVGDSEAKKIAQSLVRHLKATASTVLVPSTIHPQVSATSYIPLPGKTNVEVRIGNMLPITPLDDDFIPFMFGLTVLGKPGGFSGRLMSTVRENEGLTYGIYATASFETKSTGVHWHIYTFFTGKDLARGLAATARELRTIVKLGITHKELSIFKDIITTDRLIAHGSNERRARLYHALAIQGITPNDFEHLSERYQSLTVHEVNAALKRYINPKKLVISGVGPVTTDGRGISG